jgi:hypothetical protein
VYIIEIFFAALISTNQTIGFSDPNLTNYPIIEILLKAFLVFIGFVGLVTLVILFFTVITAFLFIQYFPSIFKSISRISLYHKLIRKEDINQEKSEFGERLREKIRIVFILNFWISVPLFLTLLFLLNTFTTPSLQTQGVTSPLDLPFILALSIVPAFLLSLRILANPTRRGIFTFDETSGSNFSDLMSHLLRYIKYGKTTQFTVEMISDAERINRIRSYKEQVTSFYFSFVGSTLILLYLFILLQIEKTKGTFDPFSTFFPMDPIISILMICAEILSILIVTIFGELYLQYADPIDQI